MPIGSDLTANQVKRELYAGDPYFRDAWDDFVECAPPTELASLLLRNASLVIFRPDAIACGRIELALSRFEDIGARPVATFPITYNRNTVREGWRYQLNIATRDRIDVMDMILTDASSILTLFRAEEPRRLPLTVEMSMMKGPSDPARRTVRDLRWQLGPGQASVLTFVHISDEPADVVRELGVFLPRSQRLDAIRRLQTCRDGREEFLREMTHQYNSQPRNNLVLDLALETIKTRLALVAGASLRLKSCLQDLSGEGRLHWRDFFAICEEEHFPLDRWEKVSIAAHQGCGHLQDIQPVLPDVGIEAWENETRV